MSKVPHQRDFKKQRELNPLRRHPGRGVLKQEHLLLAEDSLRADAPCYLV